MSIHSFTYSIPYLIVAFILFLLFLSENKKLHIFSVKTSRKVSFIIMLVFIGLRGHLYSDFISYFPFFQSLPTLGKLNIIEVLKDSGFEVGFIIYSSLIKTIFPDYFIWVFINTFIDLCVFRYIFRKYSYSEILPFIFFLAWQGLTIEFNLYRNVKAIILFLLSIQYLERRKIIPYFALNLLGVTFHTTALLFIPLYFFLHKQYSKKILWICFILVNIAYFTNQLLNIQWGDALGFLNNERVISKLNNYQDKGVSYGFSIGYLERTLTIILVLSLYEKLIQQLPINKILINCLMFYYGFFHVFSNVEVLAIRIPILFIFSYWILLSNIVYLYHLRFNYLTRMFSLLIIFKIVIGTSNIACYYDNLLWGIKDYGERYEMVNKFFLYN